MAAINVPPRLPGWHPRNEFNRPSAEVLTRVENRKQALTYAGFNAVIPVVYGEQVVGGPVIAGPAVSGSNLVYAIALSYAGHSGIERILDARLGEAVSNIAEIADPEAGRNGSVGGVSFRVFDGRQTTPWSGLVSAIPGFSDSFRGIAYAFISVPGASFTGLPQVTFRVRGRRCYDPRLQPWEPFSQGNMIPNDMLSAGNTVIAVGDNGQVRTRSGLTGAWTARDSGFGSNDIRSIAIAGDDPIPLIAGEGGRVSRGSITGATWTPFSGVSVSTTFNCIAPSVGNRVFIVGDGATVARTNSISASATWSSYPIPGMGGANLYAAVVGPTLTGSFNVIVGGAGGVVARATSGTPNQNQWEINANTGFEGETIRVLARTGPHGEHVSEHNKIVALGDGGKVSITTDGNTWSPVDAGFGSADITHAVFAEGTLYALSSSGDVRYTQDGVAWEPLRYPPPVPASGLFYAAGSLIASINATGSGSRHLPLSSVSGVWTENPVLHMLDFVTNSEFGMGAQLIGAEAAADIADSLYSGIPRTRAGLTMQDPMSEGDALSLLAEYAEVLWSYDGRDVAIIPDAPTDTIHEISAGVIREGSLGLSTAGLDQVPTQVRVMFTDRNSDTSWVSIPATAQSPEHTMHGLPNSPSSVPLPGVFNRPEAERRALQRLRRLQTPGRVEWQMFASGLPYQAGDVVRLPDIRGLQSVDVRLTAQPEMIAPLLYQMSGEIYRASNYPESGDGIAIPTGGIAFYVENSPIPEGWELVSGGDRLLREGAPGNAGNQTSMSASATIAPAGGHYGVTPALPRVNRVSLTGTGPYYYGAAIDYAPDHVHSASVSASVVPSRRGMRLIRRVGSPTLLPAGAGFLGASDLSSANNTEYTNVGRFLAVSSTNGNIGETGGGQATTSMAPQHVHNNGSTWGISRDESRPEVSFMVGVGSGGHTHTVSWSITRTLRSYALALFYSDGQGAIPEKGIVGWEGETPPPGWAFCDGSNGTVDLTERFIFLTASIDAGVEYQSENRATISFGGSTSANGSHAHIRNLRDRAVVSEGRGPQHTGVEPNHVHAVSGGGTVTTDNIQRYQLRLIQYIGE